MKNPKLLLKIFLILAAVAVGVFNFSAANAQEQEALNTIKFPVSELGDCTSAKNCKTYCNHLENIEVCVEYGKEHGLISDEEAADALKLRTVRVGPGGCTSKDTCKTYCADATHAEECVEFAEKHKLMDTQQRERYKKFHLAIRGNNKPIDCHDQHTCETFCALRSNNERCLKFARENDLIEEEEAEEISKFQRAINAQETPGDCDSKEACRTYCVTSENRDECLEFAEKFGWINHADAEKLRHDGFKGPGGCDSREACETFCNDEANQTTCLEFAKRFRILNSDEADRIVNVTNAVREAHTNMPDQIATCLRETLGEDIFNKMKAGEFSPDAAVAQSMKECMIQFAEQIRIENKTPTNTTPEILLPKTDHPEFTPLDLSVEMRECIIRLYGEETLVRIKTGAVALTAEMKMRIIECVPRLENMEP